MCFTVKVLLRKEDEFYSIEIQLNAVGINREESLAKTKQIKRLKMFLHDLYKDKLKNKTRFDEQLFLYSSKWNLHGLSNYIVISDLKTCIRTIVHVKNRSL